MYTVRSFTRNQLLLYRRVARVHQDFRSVNRHLPSWGSNSYKLRLPKMRLYNLSLRIPRIQDRIKSFQDPQNVFVFWSNTKYMCHSPLPLQGTLTIITLYYVVSWVTNMFELWHTQLHISYKTDEDKNFSMTELFYYLFCFISQACCYQRNNLRSKQKEQDKRSCFKRGKVPVSMSM